MNVANFTNVETGGRSAEESHPIGTKLRIRFPHSPIVVTDTDGGTGSVVTMNIRDVIMSIDPTKAVTLADLHSIMHAFNVRAGASLLSASNPLIDQFYVNGYRDPVPTRWQRFRRPFAEAVHRLRNAWKAIKGAEIASDWD